MSLPTRSLGGTGMEITRVGIGSWAIGGSDWAFGWGDQDDDDSINGIRHAIDRGINWIDTAAVYGLGHAEEVVARALDGVPARDRPYVFTKCGMVWDDSRRSEPPWLSAAPESIRRDVEGSLRRLGVERIDLYQMHWPSDDGTAVEDYWAALLDLKAQGKVRAVGLSNHDVDRMKLAERVGHVESLQPPFSAINRRSAAEIAWCLDHGTGVIVYSPMQSGLLTGSFSAARAARLGPNDWRSGDEEFQGSRLTRNLALVEALRPVAEARHVSVAAVAVAWTLAWPGVTGAVVGARRPEQVDAWIPAAALDLTHGELDTIAAAIGTTHAGDGPRHPVIEAPGPV
jgi:aryl-alcohol dehydrogenase-like predicted oxidoreductase